MTKFKIWQRVPNGVERDLMEEQADEAYKDCEIFAREELEIELGGEPSSEQIKVRADKLFAILEN